MKKIRGWKRRVRQLQNWTDENSTFDLSFLKENSVDYLKLFNYLDIEKIPDWYKSKISHALMNTFSAWKSEADTKLNQCNLKLVINENDIFESQIIITIHEQINKYKEKLEKYGNVDKTQPTWLPKSTNFQPYYSCSVWLEEEIDTLSLEEKEELLKNVLEVKNVQSFDGNLEKEYLIADGILWVLNHEKL